jgi:selenide,water dikinase
MNEIKLTEYSHSAGCGCKIAPDVLETILHSSITKIKDEHLLVGNDTKDDAAVYDIGNGQALISTVDFFMPIVDDPFQFGQIAAANSISDVYAMGGKPILATAILGWPVSKLPAALAQAVIDGARVKCKEAGISLAGGHSVDALEPMFGLSVNGLVNTKDLKRNSTCKEGDLIYITKKIGVGVLATALKRKQLKEEHHKSLIEQLTQLNKLGTNLGELEYVSAMTDITGFGLLGHLIEMVEGAELSAEINYASVPLIEGVTSYTSQMIVPDNLYRNWNSYEKKVNNIGPESFFTLCDPQTNGGLMLTIDPRFQNEFEQLLITKGYAHFAKPIGVVTARSAAVVTVI